MIDCRFHRDLLLLRPGEVAAYPMQLGADALGSQPLRLFPFALGAKEISRLDVALVEQRLLQVVGLLQPGAETLGECRRLIMGPSSTIRRKCSWTSSAGIIAFCATDERRS